MTSKARPSPGTEEPAAKDPAIDLTDVIEEKSAKIGDEAESSPSGGDEDLAVPVERAATVKADAGNDAPAEADAAEKAAPDAGAADVGEEAAPQPSPGEEASTESPTEDEEPEEVDVEVVEVVEEAAPPEEDLAEKLAQKQEELDRLHDRFLRLAADFDNFKKRVAKDRAEVLKFGNENIARQLLDVGDNLERALAHAENSDKRALLDGVGLVQNIFLQALEKFGIKRFSALGEAFDPSMQEAIQEVNSDDLPAGAVVFELHKGYTYHERLLRPARVVLSKGPASSEDLDEADEADSGESATAAEEGEASPEEKQDKADS